MNSSRDESARQRSFNRSSRVDLIPLSQASPGTRLHCRQRLGGDMHGHGQWEDAGMHNADNAAYNEEATAT